MSDDPALMGAWLLVLIAIGIGRYRFSRTLDRKAREPLEKLDLEGIRRAVMTTVALVLPGLEEELEADPARAFHVLYQVNRIVIEVAAEFDAEVEAPRAQGFCVYLGRFHPEPDHRVRGLHLARALRDRVENLMETLERPHPALGVATDDSLSAPFPLLSLQLERASFGRGPAGALRLARRAAPGEVRVDRERPVPDAEFVFEAAGEDRRLLGVVDRHTGVTAAESAESG